MKKGKTTWHCLDCDTEFSAERSTACLKCGSLDIEEVKRESPSISHPAVRDILRELCLTSYESPFDGVEWQKAIDKAIEKLEPYLKTGAALQLIR